MSTKRTCEQTESDVPGQSPKNFKGMAIATSMEEPKRESPLASPDPEQQQQQEPSSWGELWDHLEDMTEAERRAWQESLKGESYYLKYYSSNPADLGYNSRTADNFDDYEFEMQLEPLSDEVIAMLKEGVHMRKQQALAEKGKDKED